MFEWERRGSLAQVQGPTSNVNRERKTLPRPINHFKQGAEKSQKIFSELSTQKAKFYSPFPE
jgi:hypothetical protein